VKASATSAEGAAVDYPVATARDDVTASPTLSYSRVSGSLFPLGSTQVTVTATDEAGNKASCTFSVTVEDTTAPEVGCPGPLVAEAQDASGASVVFSTAKPRDAVTLEPSVSLSHAPGSRFPLGNTTVVLTATDAADNAASCSFSITVGDTTAPSLACPANLTVDTHAPEGTVVDYPEATASDAVSSPVSVRSSVASGSHFAPGTTPVTVTATDAAGNAATCDFQVSVRYLPVSVPLPTSGCGCATGAGPAGFGWGSLLLLGWVAARRRKSR
jgi:MYXO-CTERM domain-containing protein